MAYTYKIEYLIGKLDTDVCPPKFLSHIFPAFSGEPVNLTEGYCLVTFQIEQTPILISNMIVVTLINSGEY